MDSKAHWDAIYGTNGPQALSWYRPHLNTSLRLITAAAPSPSASIIDVGGGESTLVDDLLDLGYRNLTVLDVSGVALNATRQRVGPAARHVTWIESDITAARLPERAYDLWHDRAVFHFLIEASQRDAYVRVLARALKPGAHVVIATFGPDGPTQCSGLDVARYDAGGLSAVLRPGFELQTTALEAHHTPAHVTQQFLYCCFRAR